MAGRDAENAGFFLRTQRLRENLYGRIMSCPKIVYSFLELLNCNYYETSVRKSI